ncbi:hypothetical protein JI435_414050 [Parastagonospora nodorum SN15]|uniref:Uncharacterized protein n=1 Tax=Phaeosphaeria nodorum (strain SN15 / ATCC MYA-4574 / FGSC 10173) TaxID=321614 RepID=A0A7U2F904_PHANO|nr:hypothetical protein JI435_414050 [Parastagonospora nodorum SN15]
MGDEALTLARYHPRKGASASGIPTPLHLYLPFRNFA